MVNLQTRADPQTNAFPHKDSFGIEACIEQMHSFQSQYPEWFAMYEDSETDMVADRSTLIRLLETAPNDFLRGVIYGKLAMRAAISALTERAFI